MGFNSGFKGLKSDKNNGYPTWITAVLYMNTDIHFWSYPAQFFLDWEMFQTKVVEELKTHILCSVNFFIFSRWTLLHCVSQTAYVYWKKWGFFLNISHNTTYFVYFIKLTTCFGLYLRPSSGHKLHVILFWGNFTV